MQSMPVTIQNDADQVINTLEEWLAFAGPAGGAGHWQDFRSAKELARAWLRFNPHELPGELVNLLHDHQEVQGFEFQTAVPELRVPLDDIRGGKRRSDLVVYGRRSGRKLVVSIEAKADESFGKAIWRVLACAKPSSNLPARVRYLSQAVFGRPVDERIAVLRYQLLYGLAAAVIAAGKWQADYAVFVVHEFLSLTLDFDKVVANARDLEAFLHAVPGWEGQEIGNGRLLPPITLTGNQWVSRDVRVLFGKIRTLIPLDAPERVRPQAGFQQQSRQFLVG
jgi:hypothetical protein